MLYQVSLKLAIATFLFRQSQSDHHAYNIMMHDAIKISYS